MTNSNTPQLNLTKELQLARINGLQEYRRILLNGMLDFLTNSNSARVKDAYLDPVYSEMKQEVDKLNATLDALVDEFHNA